MTDHFFICYSGADGVEHALRLYDELFSGPPPISAWVDKRNIPPGQEWDESLAEGIKGCRALLFVSTKDSVSPRSICRQEWARALKYKKPVVPLIFAPNLEIPFRLAERQCIDFTTSFESGLAKLRTYIRWLDTPEGRLQAFKDLRADAERELRRAADPTDVARWKSDLQQLDQQISALQGNTPASITPPDAISEDPWAMPAPVVPSYFQNRDSEQDRLTQFLHSATYTVLRVVGSSGIGKSSLVARVLDLVMSAPEQERLVSGVIVLNAADPNGVNRSALAKELRRFANQRRVRVPETLDYGQDPVDKELRDLLVALRRTPLVILVENFELLLDPQTLNCSTAVEAMVLAFLSQTGSAHKLILTTQSEPPTLGLTIPARQTRLEVGPLTFPHAENLLRICDQDGIAGLRDLPQDVLTNISDRVGRSPRALEAVYWILATDPATTWNELLTDVSGALPSGILIRILSEAFGRLDPETSRVAQALAVFGRPVETCAVAYLLEPFMIGLSPIRSLKLLVNRRLARRDGGLFYVQPLEQAYLLSLIPATTSDDRDPQPTFSRDSLYRRAADYYLERRRSKTHLEAGEVSNHLAEFELRCAYGDYDRAATALLEIDRDYLLLRDSYQTVVALHGKLQGKLKDRLLQMHSLGRLGTAYYRLGRSREAVVCYENALCIALEEGRKDDEARLRGNLGNCHAEIGQTQRAIGYYSDALRIARDLDDHELQGAYLLCIANRYGELADSEAALKHFDAAVLEIEKGSDRPEDKAFVFTDLAVVLIDRRDYTRAVDRAIRASSIAEAVGSKLLQSHSQWAIALAQLYAGNLGGASGAVERALEFDVPQMNAEVYTLHGVIAVRQHRLPVAQPAFEKAIAAADLMLQQNRLSFRAYDAKGISEAGLVVCDFSRTLARAHAAFSAAREITMAGGIVARTSSLLEALLSNSTLSSSDIAALKSAALGIRS